MSIEALVLTLTLTAICALWIAAPLLRNARGLSGKEALERDRLLTAYDRLLTNIRDLDEDFATGKIAAEAYQPEREALIQRGIDMLTALDALLPSRRRLGHAATSGHGERIDASLDRSIEDAVAAYRRKAHTG